MSHLFDYYIRNETEHSRAQNVARLAEQFAERASQHDQEGSFPFDNIAALQEAGYLKLTVPHVYGGDEISLYELVLLQERLAYGDGSTALAVGWHMGQMLHLHAIKKWPEPIFEKMCRSTVHHGAMINVFASEANSGSPSRGGMPGTTAVAVDGGWILHGRKTFSTLSPILNQFIVTAYVEEEQRMCEFLVDRTPQVSIIETWDSLGMRATGSHDVLLDGVFVPEADRCTDKGLDDGGGWLLHIPACYLGIAMAARDYALDFARTYQPASLDQPIASLPSVQQMIGQMEIELRTSRSLVYEAADRWDTHASERPAMRPELGLAKYVATNHAVKVVDIAMRIVGGTSLSRNLPLERYYRDVRAGLHNPPMDNTVIQLLADSALANRN